MRLTVKVTARQDFASAARDAALITAIACACLMPVNARAISDEIQVYTDDISKPGEFGLELHVNTTPKSRSTPDYPGDSPPQHGVRFTPEFSYGIDKDWEAGLYLPTVREANGTFSASGVKLRMKWLPLKPNEDTGGWYFGSNLELSSVNARYSESRYGSELRVMAGYHAQEWHVAVNPIFELDLSRGHRSGGPDFELATKAVHDVAHGIALGAEYYAGLGKFNHPLPRPMQEHTLYLVMDYDHKPWVFNFGIGRGLNGATDRWTTKAIFDVPF